MFNIMLITVVTLNGVNVTSYEKTVIANFETLDDCKAAMRYAGTTVPVDNFVFTTTGLCVDEKSMEAFDWTKVRARNVADKTAEILLEVKKGYDLEKQQKELQRRKQQSPGYAPQPKYNYQKPSYQLDKSL